MGEKLLLERFIPGMIRVNIKSHTQHAPSPGASQRPVALQWQRGQTTLCTHGVGRRTQVGCTVDQGAIQVEQHGPNTTEHATGHGFRVAIR